ncbi:ankyrin repeat domain-containing protein 26-like [Molossus molossus]|uniref:ankyrin repeat domain-containing protein 26-like n=1 Tax=Molossus molossus TaxID=27622 RepID=UPI001747AD6E|nr:ankyrin repeat domain-containing protein 26-like [Molossus molossus]
MGHKTLLPSFGTKCKELGRCRKDEIEVLKEASPFRRTALHLACVFGHPAVVSLLADSKCLLDLCDLDNRTPLIKAVQCQQEECVAALLDRGANPDIRDIDGNSALHHAVLGESVAILAKLLLSNANMEVRNKDNLTPLLLAESEQKEQMMALLVKKGREFENMKRTNRHTSNDKGFKIEEERKKQNVSKMEVTKKIHQAAGEDGHGLIKPRDCKQTDNQPFAFMENDNSDRTSEEICSEEYKVKENINSMDDLDDLTQSTETVSDPYSNCKNFILLIGELCKNCKAELEPEVLSALSAKLSLMSSTLKNDYLRDKLEAVSSNCPYLEKENKSLQQELLTMKAMEMQCKMLEDENKKLNEKVINLRRHMKTNMVEHSELEHYKQAEKRARQDAAEHLQQVKSLMQIHRESQEHNFSVQSHLELRNKELESELLKMQSSLHFNNTKMENYVALYQEESEKRRLLENELNETINKMVQVRTELFQLTEKYCDLLSTIQTRPVLQTPCAVNTNSNSNTSFMPSTQRNPSTLIFPTMEEMKKKNQIMSHLQDEDENM